VVVFVRGVPRNDFAAAKIEAIVNAENAMQEAREIRAGCEYGAVIGDGVATIQSIVRE